MDGLTVELLYEVTKIRTNYITVQGKAWACCSAALNQWARNDKDTETQQKGVRVTICCGELGRDHITQDLFNQDKELRFTLHQRGGDWKGSKGTEWHDMAYIFKRSLWFWHGNGIIKNGSRNPGRRLLQRFKQEVVFTLTTEVVNGYFEWALLFVTWITMLWASPFTENQDDSEMTWLSK